MSGQMGAQLIAIHEEGIEVPAGHSEHGAVKHRIDVIRPALEGGQRQLPLAEGREQRARHRGLAAARAGAGNQETFHNSLSFQDSKSALSRPISQV